MGHQVATDRQRTVRTPLRFEMYDRCSFGDRRGTIRYIYPGRRLAAIEFDDDRFVLVDCNMSDLDLVMMAPIRPSERWEDIL